MKQSITIKIDSEAAKKRAHGVLDDLAIDGKHCVEFKPYVKKRSNGQNSFQWVALLGDISMQGIIDGKQFSAAVWHEFLKEKLLPEQYEEGITLKSYAKWQEMPDGTLRMIGSTTKLTTKGFSQYVEKCYAWGTTELGIRFTAAEDLV